MKKVSVVAIFLLAVSLLSAQENTTEIWTLQDCLDYAIENNIALQQSRNNYLSGLEDTYQAKSSFFPTVNASLSQGITNTPFAEGSSFVSTSGSVSSVASTTSKTSYNGSYGINANMTLWNGGRLKNALKQQKVQNSIDSLTVITNERDIRIQIIQTYLQCLYAAEAVTISEGTVEVSQATRDRAEELYKAGSISKVDFAQLESQLYTDKYSVTSAQANLNNYMVQLKQLLELDLLDEMVLAGTEADEESVLRLLPSKEEVYQNALETMPELQSSELAVTSAELSEKQSRAGSLPSLGLSAGIGTSNRSGTGNDFTNQIQDNFNENAGLTLNIPIFSGRQNKSAINKARIAVINASLDKLSAEKTILREVETTYVDATSAQAQYISASEQEKYARMSYNLTAEQFNVGMKNTVELITAKNELLSAQLSRIQAKYMALLNLEILDVYQGK